MSTEDNLTFLEQATEREFQTALLDTLGGNPRTPLTFHPDDSPSLAVRTLFQLTVLSKEKLKNAAVGAILEWTPTHTYEALRQLALVVAYTRASRGLRPLQRIIDAGRIREFTTWENAGEDGRHLVGTIVRVIAGFAPADEVKEIFQRWIHDTRMHAACAAVITATLSACAPEEYARHLSEFFSIYEEHGAAYDFDAVMREISRCVGPKRLIDELDNLSPPLHAQAVMAICGQPTSPFYVMSSDEGEVNFVPIGGSLKLPYTPSTAARADAVAKAFKNWFFSRNTDFKKAIA